VNTIRKLMAEFPDLPMEPWVRRQLGRIVPELSPEADGLSRPDPGDPAFVEANRWLYQWLGRKVSAIVFDDGQFLDHETIALGLSLEGRLASLVKSGDFPPILVGIRPGELPPAEEETLRARAQQGQAAWIDVDPLSGDSVRQLVAGMGLDAFQRIAGDIADVSGGSPYLILELLRELLASGGAAGLSDLEVVLAAGLQALLRRKLRRLSPEALRVARVIAMGGEDLDLVTLASVAGLPADRMALCLRELERHHLVQGRWFASGAVPPVVLEGMSDAVRSGLAGRIADWRRMRSHGGMW
jgi:hypothetical protein